MKKVAAALVLVVFVSACSGFGVLTEWTDDVPSGCEKVWAAYDAHMLACRVKPGAAACTAANLSLATSIQAEANNFCSGQPESTGENVARIDDLVARQLAVGRTK